MLPVSGGFSVYVALRHRGELAVRQLFLIEVLLQDGRAVIAAKHFRPCDQRAVTRDLIMFDALRGGNQGSVKHVLVVDFARNFTRFFQDWVVGRTNRRRSMEFLS